MRRIIPYLLSASVALAAPVETVLTAYCAGECCTGTFPGKIPGQTASGKMAKAGRTIAAPKDVPFGTIVKVDGQVLGIVEDRGGAIKWIRTKNRGKVLHLDVYMDTHKEAVAHGVRKVLAELDQPKRPSK